MRALIDTCIIIDALQAREPFFADAKRIMLSAARCQFDGFLTAKAITDIYYLMHRHLHDDKMVREYLQKLCELFVLLDTTEADVQQAFGSRIKDFEDAVMVESAKRSQMDCIITRNIKDYKKSSLSIYTPAEFLDLLPTKLTITVSQGDN